jgi:hypothetical protein
VNAPALLFSLHSFFSSTTWHVIRNVGILIACVFYVAMVWWVLKDSRRRIEDPWLVGTATLVGTVPLIGPLVYMLFRPPEYLADVRERALEIRAMEDRLSHGDLHCPVCRSEVDASYLVCPICTTKLKQACVNCKQPMEALWQICPYCETPVEPSLPAEYPTLQTGRRRRQPREPS